MSDTPDTFYKTFSEKQLTSLGGARRGRIERGRLALLMKYASPPGPLLEVGPGHGSLAALAIEAGWKYSAIEPSPALAERLRAAGIEVVQAMTPPIPRPDASCRVLYADQVLEHMSGIDAAREFVAEARRILRSKGVLFVVVPDYLKERQFFWDIDYTHNFITTERRMRQLLYDGGFEVTRMVRAWDDKEGQKRYTTEIVASNVQFLDSAAGASDRSHSAPASGGTGAEPDPFGQAPDFDQAPASDDIPF